MQRLGSKNQPQKKVAIVGARGYSGLDLVRLLLKHPHVQIEACFATEDFKLSEYLSEEAASQVVVRPMSDLLATARAVDVVFLATPAATSMELAPNLLAAGAHVIDLSGAFRLKGKSLKNRLALYTQWYGFQHSASALLDQAEYGLVPWIESVHSGAAPRLIANPGCYATSILMAILPLLKNNLILPESLVIDAKSGTSGAGRKPQEHLLFTEVEGECLPYRVGRHQHFPEIQEMAEAFAGVAIDPMLSTSLLNTRRGIISGIFARLRPGMSIQDVSACFQKTYEDYPLVRVGSLRETSPRVVHPLLSLKRVVGSPRTHIAYEIDGSKLYLFSSIDNLLKGAASQAVENLNRLCGISMGTGLTEIEGVL